MPFIKGDITVKQTGPEMWELLEPVVYIGREGPDRPFIIPAGFSTDFASVPAVFVWLIPRYGVYTKAAVLHDFLCCDGAEVNRADADGIFRRALRELGVSLIRRWMMWAAVRVQSRLSEATWRQRAAWVVVTLPSAVFLAVPALMVGVWLLLFLALESIAYAVSGPRKSGGPPNKPSLSGAPGPEGELRKGGLPDEPPPAEEPPPPLSHEPADH